MKLITLDYECYYSTGYSLSGMTTEKYINDKRFALYLVTATDGNKEYSAWGLDQIRQLVGDLGVQNPGTFTLAHNGKFDHAITEWKLDIPVNFKLCSMLMARHLGLGRTLGSTSLATLSDQMIRAGHNVQPKGKFLSEMSGVSLDQLSEEGRKSYLEYGMIDTRNTHVLGQILINEINKHGSIQSLEVMDMFLNMYIRPTLAFDVELLKQYEKKLEDRKVTLLHDMSVKYGFPDIDSFKKELGSAKKFAGLLARHGIEAPMKVSEKKTEAKREATGDPNHPPIMTYAFAKTDLPMMELLEHENQDVVDLVEAKIGSASTIAMSRTKTFLELAKRGGIPVAIDYCGAHTGRGTGTDNTNFQNLPKRGKDKTLRQSIIARKVRHLVGGADSSQVEARVLAYGAGEDYLLEIFRTGGDPYSVMAEKIFGVPAADIRAGAKDENHPHHALYTYYRNIGKQTILGCGYQMSGIRFAGWLKEMKVTLVPNEQNIREWYSMNFPGDSVDQEEVNRKFAEFKEGFHEAEALRINQVYRSTNTKIVAFWKTCQNVLKHMSAGGRGKFGGPNNDLFEYVPDYTVLGVTSPAIRLPDGFWIVYPELKAKINTTTGFTEYSYVQPKGKARIENFIYGGKLAENLIQGTAFGIMKWQAVGINKHYQIALNVHDEWISAVPEDEVELATEVFTKWMSAVPPWIPGVPIACEAKFAENYGSV